MVESLDTIVNPKDQKVSLVKSKIDPSGYEWISDLIEARMFTFVRLYDNGDGVYIDDEGLYADQRFFWIHKNYPQPLVNKGLFMGTDYEGDSIPPQTSLTQFKKDVKFIGDTHDFQVMMMFKKSKSQWRMVMKITDQCSLNDDNKMTPSIAVMIAEGIETPRSEDEFIQAWQYIYDSNLYLQLQGWYGRRIQDMIREGILDA